MSRAPKYAAQVMAGPFEGWRCKTSLPGQIWQFVLHHPADGAFMEVSRDDDAAMMLASDGGGWWAFFNKGDAVLVYGAEAQQAGTVIGFVDPRWNIGYFLPVLARRSAFEICDAAEALLRGSATGWSEFAQSGQRVMETYKEMVQNGNFGDGYE